MLKRPARIWRWVSERVFKHLSLTEETSERVKKLAEEGQVIYVMRSRSMLDYLAFNYMFVENKLPLARFSNGVNLSLYRGFFEMT